MSVEAQIAEWRAHLASAPAIDDRDVEELEAHLRDEMAGLDAAGLAEDEAFLVAIKRIGSLDAVAREFAREHGDRLWKQLVLSTDDDLGRSRDWVEALAFAVAAAVAVQVARLVAGFPDSEPTWFTRNVGLFVLPFLAGYFARRRRLGVRSWVATGAAFALCAVVVNVFPYDVESASEILVALHLPVVLWFVVSHPYMGGTIRSHERRMDFVRFTGEWAIYYALIALGGAVLLGLTALVLEPVGPDVAERVVEWVLPSGAAGAVVVAAWLVEAKQRVVENMAPVLTMLFTPLFALMLVIAAVTYAVVGYGRGFDRELLGVLDALLVVVLGLVLYGLSARDPLSPAGWMDRVRLVAVVAALALDLLVLGSLLARIGDLGFTPNRAATLGLNLVLLVNLAGTAWSATFLARREAFRVERWQTAYLPVFAAWAAAVVFVLPPTFAFS